MADPKTKTPDSHVGLLKWNPATNKWLFWDGAITVSGSVAVTGPLTDAQLRASPVSISDDSTFYKPIIDESTAGTTYIGLAAPGASQASAVWRIRKLVESSGVMTATDADGDSNFDNVWNDRASLSYS